MYEKLFFLVLVVLVAQNQADPSPPKNNDRPLAGIMQDYLNLFVHVLTALFENKNISEECKQIFQQSVPLPKETGDEIRACTARHAQLAEEIITQLPEKMKKKASDFINGRVRPSGIIETFEMVSGAKEVGHAIHNVAKGAGVETLVANTYHCINPLLEHVRCNFRQNVAQFDKCLTKSSL